MGSATPPLSKISEAMERVEFALIELEYAIADFAQHRIDEPYAINSLLILALRDKMQAVENVFKTVPSEIIQTSTNGVAVN